MEQLKEAANLKCALASQIQLLFVLYYSITLFFDGVLPFLNYLHSSSDVSSSQNIYFRPAQDLAEQTCKMIVLLCLLRNLRVQELPPFYTVGMVEGEEDLVDGGVGQNLVNEFREVEFGKCVIDLEQMDSQRHMSNVTSGSRESEVCILNPGNYESRTAVVSDEQTSRVMGCICYGVNLSKRGVENGDFQKM